MKISEVVNLLKQLQDIHGDLEVYRTEDVGIMPITDIKIAVSKTFKDMYETYILLD